MLGPRLSSLSTGRSLPQVCRGTCSLFASFRRLNATDGDIPSLSSGDAFHFATPKPKGESSRGSKRSNLRPAPPTGGGRKEGLMSKEAKTDVAGLRSAVLKVAEAVPPAAWRESQWRRHSYPGWRAFVRAASGSRDLMQVCLVCLDGGLLRREMGQ